VALQPDEEPLPVGDSILLCYGVDMGMGIFVDAVAQQAHNKLGTEGHMKLLEREAVEDPDFMGEIYAFGNHHLAQFSTGYGDGCYSTYVGFDSTGAICRLLTDFQMVSWWTIDPP
jgi:hypothetical protein